VLGAETMALLKGGDDQPLAFKGGSNRVSVAPPPRVGPPASPGARRSRGEVLCRGVVSKTTTRRGPLSEVLRCAALAPVTPVVVPRSFPSCSSSRLTHSTRNAGKWTLREEAPRDPAELKARDVPDETTTARCLLRLLLPPILDARPSSRRSSSRRVVARRHAGIRAIQAGCSCPSEVEDAGGGTHRALWGSSRLRTGRGDYRTSRIGQGSYKRPANDPPPCVVLSSLFPPPPTPGCPARAYLQIEREYGVSGVGAAAHMARLAELEASAMYCFYMPAQWVSSFLQWAAH